MITGRDLTKYYGSIPALDRVSFEFDRSEIFGVIGHNGAGKTTLLKILSGLITPTSGELSINGIDVVKDPVGLKEMLGYLPEESRLYETMKVDAYLSFFGEIYGMKRDLIRERCRDLLSSLDLEPDGKKIGELSKGMRRKVAIARSLIHDPSFLVYDEPTSGLDPMTSRYIIDYLRELKTREKTIVLSAHNLYQVEAICDRVMILRRGTVVAIGSMQELREMFGSVSYSVYFTIRDISRLEGIRDYMVEAGFYHVRCGTIEEMNDITRTITSAGGTVERIESHYPSLEEMLVKIGK
ncbi:MAG TPA: ABC transporter ATP-binding protein [Methanoregulaceae archaeon]|nr:ABC transporter ATP-binding protein [Methanoregulaceae archaeon]